MTIKEINTIGKIISSGQPWSLSPDIEGIGKLVIGKTIEDLPEMITALGETPPIISTGWGSGDLPWQGIISILEQTPEVQLPAIQEEASLIICNQALTLAASYRDNQYWPNLEKGGH